ncbi:MAG: hypothetical protein HQ567_07545 [Candidatus Nealsonbacteria bacterium]|nr:hypothetical protein [Candidatus Nealsonbacteria bacterium]
MAGQLIPPPGCEPTVPDDATPEQCILAWADLMDACEQFLLARLREEIGPDGDLKAAYRQWYRQQMEEHDRMIRQMVTKFNRRSGSHAE